MAERLAILETTVDTLIPRIEQRLSAMDAKFDKVLEKLEADLARKADKEELGEIKQQVNEVQKKVWIWSGAVLVLSTIAGWFGKDIFIK